MVYYAQMDPSRRVTIFAGHYGSGKTNIAYFCGRAIDIDPKTGALLTKEGADLWKREYANGWELA